MSAKADEDHPTTAIAAVADMRTLLISSSLVTGVPVRIPSFEGIPRVKRK
jgi:hypothetical protein